MCVAMRPASTLSAAVFICGAVLGRIGRKIVLRLSQTRTGLAKYKALIDPAYNSQEPITPRCAVARRFWHSLPSAKAGDAK